MSKTTIITSPSAAHMKGDISSFFGSRSITFTDGVAKVDDISDALLGYFKANGFGVDDEPAADLDAAPEPADPRDLEQGGIVQVGTPLRDAAVDPDPDVDFLAPTNAGEANPHGPDVVSPGIHANQGIRPVKAGDVTFEGDTAAQNDAESAHATEATDGTPVKAPEDYTDEERELLGLPPADGEQSLQTSGGDAGDPDAESPDDAVDDAETLKGDALTQALKDRDLPVTGTADEKRQRVAEYDAAQGD